MKILLVMISPASAAGGMEKHFMELANGLAAAGHVITCVSAVEHMQDLDSCILKYPIDPRASRYSLALYYNLFKLLKENRFDIAHAQGSKAADILKRMCPLFAQTKFVATIHNFKNRYPSTQAFCRIIAVSKALAADIGHNNISVVYNGLRPPAPNKEKLELPGNLARPVWLSVGRLVPAKGFDDLIKAFQYARGSLIIAGSGPEAKRLDEQVASLDLKNKVKLIGHQDDIWSLMDSVDAVVISSRREGFSYVFAEALIAGKPIISTDVPIANEFLPENSIIPQDSSPQKFASYLNRELDDIALEEQPARLRSKTELTFSAMIANTLCVYRECLEG